MKELSEEVRLARSFPWCDREKDLAHLGRIALRYDPQGRFTLLSEVDWPADAGPDTEVTIRFHPTWTEWSLYMIEKYGQRIGHALTLRFVDELGLPVDPPSA